MAEERNFRKVRRGYVVSDKMDKTISVELELRTTHPLYGKVVRSTRTVKAHDGGNSSVDFFCGFFFVCLYIASWISADIDVVHHPAKCFHEIVVSTKQAAEKSLPPAVLLFIFI